MRRITEQHHQEADFNQVIQGLVRSSPWWMISLVFHGVVLVILWNIKVQTNAEEAVAQVQSGAQQQEVKIEEEPIEEPEPEQPEEEIVETPILTEEVSDHNEVDTNSEFHETAGDEGLSTGPFKGPSTNSAIGLGGGAGGGRKGRGGSKNLRAGGGSAVTENAVDLGLKWLADHQDVEESGMWDCDEFMKHDPADDKCDGPGKALFDPASPVSRSSPSSARATPTAAARRRTSTRRTCATGSATSSRSRTTRAASARARASTSSTTTRSPASPSPRPTG